jgi:uncharacterized membrane protein
MKKKAEIKNSTPESNYISYSDDYHNPSTVEELTETNVKTILQLEATAKDNQTTSERFAKTIANFCGSVTFVWVHIVWFGGWVLINSLPGINHFDCFSFYISNFSRVIRSDFSLDVYPYKPESGDASF